MRILITGGFGFVGSELARSLKPSFGITCADNCSGAASFGRAQELMKSGVETIGCNILEMTDADFRKADWVIHAAADPSVLSGTRSDSAEVLQNHISGMIRVLEYCRRYGSGLTFISSSRVYSISALWNGAAKMFPEGLPEEFPTDGQLSFYGSGKRCAEQIAVEYAWYYKFPLYINRCGVMAGASQFGTEQQGIVSHWIQSWKQRKSLRYIGYDGKGGQTRDVLHPSDLASLIHSQIIAGNPKKSIICNVSGGADSAWSLRELSDWCAKEFGNNRVEVDMTNRIFDVPWLVLDNRKACQLFKWRPMMSKHQIWEEIANAD